MPIIWPKDTQPALTSFYGTHLLAADGRPNALWQSKHLQIISLPYPMRLAWDVKVTVKRMRCHVKVADSLRSILEEILLLYGDKISEVRKAGMDLFGGCYEFRRISGSARLSTHAWGAGIDLDPTNNPLGKKWTDGMMPGEVVEIFNLHGWAWGGNFTTRPDCMHFQAAVR